MTRVQIGLFLMLAAMSGIAASCSGRSQATVTLDETPVVSGGMGWAVVSLAYVRITLEPSAASADSGTARRGDVGRIAARARSFEGRDAGVWLRLELGSTTGWIHQSSAAVYSSEAEARKAAEAYE